MWIDPVSRRFLKEAGTIPTSQGRGPVVLMYHSITPDNKKPDSKWSVAEKSFCRQLNLLKEEGWHTVCVRDLARREVLPPRTVAITFDDGFADNFEHGFRHILDRGMQATWFIVTRDIGGFSGWTDGDVPQRSMLTRECLREMAVAGMEIGAHTRTHVRLPGLDPITSNHEISGSKKELEDLLGMSVESFAYPYGLFDDQCVEIVRKACYRVACTTRTGWLGSEQDLMRVRRVGIFSHDSLSLFARKLAFADYLSWKGIARYATGRMLSRFGY